MVEEDLEDMEGLLDMEGLWWVIIATMAILVLELDLPRVLYSTPHVLITETPGMFLLKTL